MLSHNSLPAKLRTQATPCVTFWTITETDSGPQTKHLTTRSCKLTYHSEQIHRKQLLGLPYVICTLKLLH